MAGEDKGTGSLAEAFGLKCVEWRDRTGRGHSLPPLSIADLIEIENEFGSVDGWAEKKAISARMWAEVLWRSMRREGLSKAQVRERKWAVGREVAAELVPIGTGAFKAVDAYGDERTFNALTLRDLVEIEGVFGRFAEWGDRPTHPVAFIQRVIWCSLRKDGRTPEQVAANDYVMDEQEAGMIFHPSVASGERFSVVFSVDKIVEASDLWVKLMGGSGIAIKPSKEVKPEDPPQAGAAATAA